MIKRISVLLLLLALSMTALFGCSQTKETKHASAIINTDKTNKEENLTPVTLNEVAHSIFYAPMYVVQSSRHNHWLLHCKHKLKLQTP